MVSADIYFKLSKKFLFNNSQDENIFYGNIFGNTIKGGIMTPEEAKVFENDPLFADSLLIRKYDELAKIENMKINVSLWLPRIGFHI